MGENRIRVAVVFGGRSGEHDVSCQSAASILSNLDRERYEVVPVKIDRDGHWTVAEDDRTAVGAGDRAAPTALPEGVGRSGGTGTRPLGSMAAALDRLRGVDVVFPALHGPNGEDGTLQSVLELAGLPFVGNGVLASAAGIDKEYTKKLLAAAGLAVADGVVLRPGQDHVPAADRARLGLPVFVKPARAGSSLGVSKVDSWEALPGAVEVAKRCDTKVLVEAAVPGREIDIGVLERPDGTIEVSPPLEIRIARGRSFFDYDAKYEDAGTVFEIPARLDRETLAALRDAAVRSFEALGCSGLLRVDCFVDGSGAPVVNEVNTFPGFTAASQYPRMWRAAGLAYPALLDTLIETAMARAGRSRARAAASASAD